MPRKKRTDTQFMGRASGEDEGVNDETGSQASGISELPLHLFARADSDEESTGSYLQKPRKRQKVDDVPSSMSECRHVLVDEKVHVPSDKELVEGGDYYHLGTLTLRLSATAGIFFSTSDFSPEDTRPYLVNVTANGCVEVKIGNGGVYQIPFKDVDLDSHVLTSLQMLQSKQLLTLLAVQWVWGDPDGDRLVLSAYVSDSALDYNHVCSHSKAYPHLRNLLSVLDAFRGTDTFQKDATWKELEYSSMDPSEISDFYAKVAPNLSTAPLADQPPGMTSQLLRYQRQALYWMLQRENQPTNPSTLHDLWVEIPRMGRSMDTRPLYANKYTGRISNVKPEPTTPCPGGILADEMGLGKTVETIALLLAHRRPENQVGTDANTTIYGPGKVRGLKPVCGKGTLIVSPSSIKCQWLSELSQHVEGGLKVLDYTGAGVRGADQLSAVDLTQYDVVLTSYQVLQREVHWAREKPDRTRRMEQVYVPEVSPLVLVQWWRVVLDEAQMVECSTTNAAEMALMIPAVHRWGVTGTPIGRKGLEDLYGLAYYLNLDPYGVKLWWKKVVGRYRAGRSETQQFLNHFKTIMWRVSKACVRDQLVLPPQQQMIYRLKFTPIEAHYYRGLEEASRQELREANATPHDIFLRLRQACIHPQLGSHSQRVFGQAHRSLSEVLLTLLRQTETDTNAKRRGVCHALKRQAFVCEHLKDYTRAEEVHKTIIAYIQEAWDLLEESAPNLGVGQEAATETDVEAMETQDGNMSAAFDGAIWLYRERKEWLELKHMALFNLASLYLHREEKEEADRIYKEADQARVQLLAGCEQLVDTCKGRLQALTEEQKLGDLSQLEMKPLEYVGLSGRFAVDRVNDHIEELNKQLRTMINYRALIFTTLLDKPLHTDYDQDAHAQDDGITAQNKYDKEVKKRKNLLQGKLLSTKEDIDKRVIVGVQSDTTCFKGLMEQIKAAKDRLDYNHPDDSLLNTVLRTAAKYLDSQVDALKQLEREIADMRKLWNARILFYRKLQELSDAVAVPEILQDLEAEMMFASQAETHCRLEVERNTGQLRYLRNLLQESNGGTILPQCSICMGEGDGEVAPVGVSKHVMTPCGHVFHTVCLRMWVTSHRTCPTCKHRVLLDQLAPVTCGQSDAANGAPHGNGIGGEEDELPPFLSRAHSVQGSYGTKVETVVRYLLHLKLTEPGTKSIVFSQWERALRLVAMALEENGIGFVQLQGSTMKTAATAFKTDPSIHVFLLTGKQQSSGLTLVAATHVFLLEPIMNRAMELQAINRVHRIGQSRDTFVHRLVIRDTVEEHINNYQPANGTLTVTRESDPIQGASGHEGNSTNSEDGDQQQQQQQHADEQASMGRLIREEGIADGLASQLLTSALHL